MASEGMLLEISATEAGRLSIARAEDEKAGLCLVYELAEGIEPEGLAAFTGAVRRGKGLSHPNLGRIIDGDRHGYRFAVERGERLAAIVEGLTKAGHQGLPSNLALTILHGVTSGLSALHDAGQAMGDFTARNVVLGYNGRARLVDRPMLALDAQLAGAMSTALADVKAVGRLLDALSPLIADTDSTIWTGLTDLSERAQSGEFLDTFELLEAFEKIEGEPDGLALGMWLAALLPARAAAWSVFGEDAPDTGDPKQRAAHLAKLLTGELTLTLPEPEKPPEPEGIPEELLPARTSVAEPSRSSTRGPAKRQWSAVLDDGDMRVSKAEDDVPDEDQAWTAWNLDELLEPLDLTTASGDPNSALVLEVVRCVGPTVMSSETVHVGGRFAYQGTRLAKMTERGAVLALPKNARGVRYQMGGVQPFEGELTLEAGERAAILIDGVTFRIRVDRAAREVGKSTGIKRPWKLWAACAAIGVGVHIFFFLGVISLSSMGIQLTVDQPEEEERFARLKPPSELPKKRPKPKPKKPKPKPKIKPKPQKMDPTEAPPELPDKVRQKISKRIQPLKKGETRAQSLLKQLVDPNPDEAPSVNQVRANIDAIASSGSSSVFQVAGDLAAGARGDSIKVGGGSGKVVTSGKVGKNVGKLKGRKGGRRIKGRVKKLRSRTKVRGSLSKSAVFSAIDRHMGKIQRCYEKELMKGKKLSGKINAEWTITTSGSVRGAKAKLNTVGSPKVASCLIKVLKRIKFPRPKGGEVVVVFPFVFAAQ